MSFPDQTPPPPPHALTSPPLYGLGEGGRFWPPFNDQQQNQHPDSIPQFNHHQHNQNPNSSPFKRSSRPPEKSPNYPQMNPRTTNPPTLPGNRGTSHIFYKTRICAKFMEGTCRNGEHCTFAHGPEDLREPPPNWQELIREKERGAGAGGGGGWGEDQRGVIHRMKICKKYYNGEECPYGDKCNFLHERPPQPQPQPQPPVKKFKVDGPGVGYGERESAAISIGTTGDRGPGDPAVFWKTKMCSRWEMGLCRYGERCHFAHGVSDLLLPEEAEMAVGANIAIPRKPAAFVPSVAPPANLVVGGSVGDGGGGGEEKKSKWKLKKKINRIYADWLDDMSPPRDLPDNKEEMMLG